MSFVTELSGMILAQQCHKDAKLWDTVSAIGTCMANMLNITIPNRQYCTHGGLLPKTRGTTHGDIKAEGRKGLKHSKAINCSERDF